MKISVKVRLKKSILDPQGKAVHHALEQLGFAQFSEVRIGKLIELEVDDRHNQTEVQQALEDASRQLLSNPVIEDFEIEYHKDAS